MNRYASAISFSLLIVVGCVILREWFGPVLWNANQTPFNLGGDGLKNYFTLAAFIPFGSGSHFPSFYYPFGEHVVFTDGQPLLGWLLKPLHLIGVPVERYTVGLVNWLMIASIPLAWMLLFAIARRKGLPPAWAAGAALLTGGMAPQIARMSGGHYALAYVCFFPLIWLLLLRAEGRPARALPWAGLFVAITASAFVHPYYLLMGCGFSGLYLGFQAAARSPRDGRSWGLALLFLAGPMVLFQGFMALTDGAPDRPSMPYGYFLTRASWHSVFMPWAHPWPEIWRNGLFGRPQPPDFEGIAYVGWVVALGCLALAQRQVAHIFRLRRFRITPDSLTLIAAVLLLMVAFTWPLVWFYDEPPQWLGPFRQFRALGRFAWPFYFISSLYVARYGYLWFRLLRRRRLSGLGWALTLLAAGVWYGQMAYHGSSLLRPLRAQIGLNDLVSPAVSFKPVLAEKQVNIDDFQAIIPLPVFFVGTEKFIDGHDQGPIQKHAYRLVMDTGLPLVNGNASRSSVSRVVQLRQLFADQAIPRPVLEKIDAKKSFLLLVHAGSSLSAGEQRLVEKGQLIGKHLDLALYRLAPADLCEDPDLRLAEYDRQKPLLRPAAAHLLTTDSAGRAWYDGFGDGWETFGKMTKKADPSTHTLELYAGELPFLGKITASFWLRIDPAVHGFPVMYWAAYDTEGQVTAQQELATRYQFEAEGEWLRMEAHLMPPPGSARLSVWLMGRNAEAESFLLAPADAMVGGEKGALVFFNNYFIRRGATCRLSHD